MLGTESGIKEDEVLKEKETFNKICALGVRFHEVFRGRVPISCVNGIYTPEQVHYLLGK